MASNLEAASVEISSLQHTAQCDKIRDFLRRNANVDTKELAMH